MSRNFEVGDRVILIGNYDGDHRNPVWGGKHGQVIGTITAISTAGNYPISVDWDNSTKNVYRVPDLAFAPDSKEREPITVLAVAEAGACPDELAEFAYYFIPKYGLNGEIPPNAILYTENEVWISWLRVHGFLEPSPELKLEPEPFDPDKLRLSGNTLFYEDWVIAIIHIDRMELIAGINKLSGGRKPAPFRLDEEGRIEVTK